MRIVLRVAIVVMLLAVPSITSAAGGHQVRAINCGREQFKPTRIILSCGDGGIWLGKLSWSRWGSSTAVGTGSYNENTCTPTCSAGHTVSKPVRVTLSMPKMCPGQTNPAFGRATFSFANGTPRFAYHRFTFRCPVLPGQY